VKKPYHAAAPARGIVPPAAKGKGAAQPGNAPGRGKAAHAKPAPKKPPPKPKVSAKIKAQRHAAAVKAAKTRAANAKKARAHPRRQLALGEGVACCSAEALAASLRLAGWPVTDGDVLALYRRTARDDDAGASILATLEAAGEYGLAGWQPAFREILEPRPGWHELPTSPPEPGLHGPILLGLALPAPHAVLDTGSEWITWGQAWPTRAFPDAVIEEAWEVTWPGIRRGSRLGSRPRSGTSPARWSTPGRSPCS
jgi:hypothetical protein